LFTLFGPLCAQLRTDAEFRRRRRRKSLAPPPAEFWSARVGAPVRQPDLVRASRKTDGGAAEGSTRPPAQKCTIFKQKCVGFLQVKSCTTQMC